MKLLKILFILVMILTIFPFCSPPPYREETIENIHFKGNYKKEDAVYFLRFFKEMQEAVISKNTEKAYSFYSKDFMSDSGVKLDKVKKNLAIINKAYSKINYTMSDVNVHIQKSQAVSMDNYTYFARPVKRGYEVLNHKGKERIYWKKEKDEWKIINWVNQ